MRLVFPSSTYVPELGMSPSMGCAPGAGMSTPRDTLFLMGGAAHKGLLFHAVSGLDSSHIKINI